jgi:hypothetical protein
MCSRIVVNNTVQYFCFRKSLIEPTWAFNKIIFPISLNETKIGVHFSVLEVCMMAGPLLNRLDIVVSFSWLISQDIGLVLASKNRDGDSYANRKIKM